MARRSMGEYVPLSVSAMDDDAMLVCDPLAELLFYRVMQVAGGLPTDGYLTEAQIVHRAGARIGTPAKVRALLRQLVAAGPIEAVDGGYQLRAWLKWNKSAEELGRDRAKDRDRKRAERSGQPPDGGGNPPAVRPDTDGTPAGLHTESDGSPNGVHAESQRSPASRAPTYAQHGTALNGTTTEPSVPRAAEIDATGHNVTAQSLIGEWVDHCATRPPGRTVGQVAKLLGEMLAEGVPAVAVRSGLARWHSAAVADPNGKHPSTLPGFVHAAANAGTGFGPPDSKPSTTDQRVRDHLELAAELRAEEAPAPQLRALPGGAA